MRKRICLVLFLAAVLPAVMAANGAESEVRNVIRQFHQALDRRDVSAIEGLVSPDIVVLENGHRNEGWVDFRDNHLVPEFKEPSQPSKWEFVKVAVSSEMAWGYTKQTIEANGKDGKRAGHLVWSAYVLQKTGPAWKVVLLDWSIRRLGAGE